MSVKPSRTIFKCGKDVYILRVRIAQCSQVCAVKWSSNKNDSQNFLTLVTDVTTAPMGATLAGSDHPLIQSILFPVTTLLHGT